MKKIIIIILISILLTGCTVNYNLNIGEEGFDEKITILSENESESSQLKEFAIPISIFESIPEPDPSAELSVDKYLTMKIDGYEYYKSSLEKKNNLNILKYNYKFEPNLYDESYIINSAYQTITLKQYDHNDDGIKDYIILSASGDFKPFEMYSELIKIKINITSEYEIISSNADEVKENKLTWYIDRNNIKDINLVYDPNQYYENKHILKNTLLLLAIIISASIIIAFFLYLRSKRVNKI